MNLRFSRMRLIAMREWSQRIRQRSYLIATAVQIVVVLGIVLAPVVISAIFGDDEEGTSAAEVIVVDRTNLEDVTGTLNDYVTTSGLEDQVVFREGSADLDPEAAISDDDADGVLTITRDPEGALAFVFTNEDGDLNQSGALVYSVAGELTLRDNLVRAGVDAEQAQQVSTTPQITMEATDGGQVEDDDAEQGFRYGIAYFSALVMYMVVLIYGMWVAQGVVEEKNSRIMEIMINAASPTELMYGKIIGIGMAGLTQLVPTLVIAGIGLASQQWLADTLGATGIDLAGIDFTSISLTLIVFFLIYFLLGFLLYAALYAGVGSLVSRQEDVQTVMAPMTFAVVIGFFGAIFTLSAPDSLVAKVVSIVPFTSPMAMVPRILLGDPESWEIALSIALLAGTGVLAVVLASRIYRMGVLMYGQKPSLKVIFRRDMITAAR